MSSFSIGDQLLWAVSSIARHFTIAWGKWERLSYSHKHFGCHGNKMSYETHYPFNPQWKYFWITALTPRRYFPLQVTLHRGQWPAWFRGDGILDKPTVVFSAISDNRGNFKQLLAILMYETSAEHQNHCEKIKVIFSGLESLEFNILTWLESQELIRIFVVLKEKWLLTIIVDHLSYGAFRHSVIRRPVFRGHVLLFLVSSSRHLNIY